jgi:hypothetical protein
MLKTLSIVLASCAWLVNPVWALDYTAGDYSGAQMRISGETDTRTDQDGRTGAPVLPRASYGRLAPIYGHDGRGLPPTSLAGFVDGAGGLADRIFGDEGAVGPPPDNDGFGPDNRINAGIQGRTSEGLTTGHPSVRGRPGGLLPSAWGRDEFLPGGQEWAESISGNARELPGGQVGGGYYNPSAGTFPGADGAMDL